MKISTFFLTLLMAWPAGHVLANEDSSGADIPVSVQDSASEREADNTQTTKKPPVKEGDTIWLEQKITPTTRWLEQLVKPLSTWMEQKIQSPQTTIDKEPQRLWSNPEAVSTTTSASPDGAVITPQQAATNARQLIQGEVLKVKWLPSSLPPRYRVKLISRAGEIHILYINAHTGALMRPVNDSVRQ